MSRPAGQEPTWADWPELLQRIAECCGAGVALRLASAYGGREIYIPTPDAIDESHHLALTLGLASARQIADTLRVGKIVIPMGPTTTRQKRADAIRRMRREGKSNPQIARALGIHLRTVELRHQVDRAIRAAAESETPDLFDH